MAINNAAEPSLSQGGQTGSPLWINKYRAQTKETKQQTVSAHLTNVCALLG